MTDSLHDINTTKAVTIAFDGDDTLWPNESFYEQLDACVRDLLVTLRIDTARFEAVRDELLIANIPALGYGMKVYTLTLVEAFCRTSPTHSTAEVSQLMALARPYIFPATKPFADAIPTLEYLYRQHPLMLITKGDLTEQNYKIDSSGLRGYFSSIHIVPKKTVATYRNILSSHGIQAENVVMVGNSYQSDIAPVIEAGGKAIYIPGVINHVLELQPDAQQLLRDGITSINRLTDLIKLV